MASNKKKMNLIYGSIFLGLILAYVIFVVVSKNKLINNHSLTVGMPYDCTANGRGNSGRLNIDFTFKLNGEQYKSTIAFLTSEISENDFKNYFIGKEFPVAYFPSNPSNSILLIRPKDFSHFGYSFPDSLQWVLKYLHPN